MPYARYDIFFSGALMPGADENSAKQRIRDLFNAGDEQLERLFSGTPVAIKRNVDMDTAVEYRLAFREAGALVDIRPVQTGEQTSASPNSDFGAAKSESAKTAVSWTLAPAGTGSLIDCAPAVEPRALPDTNGLSLATPGSEPTPPPPPPAPNIDTGKLSMAPPDFTLEDCQIAVPPVAVPDTSELSLEDPGEPPDESSETR